MLDIMRNRRSIRKFKDRPVEPALYEQLIHAALLAPSSMNKRPVALVAVTDRALIGALAACKNFGTAALETAPLVFAVTADSALSDVWVEDASIVGAYLLLMAEVLGLGANWIQIRRRSSGTEDSERAVRSLLGIPERYGVVCLVAVGHRDEHKAPAGEEVLHRGAVHHNRFQAPADLC
ncbi:MAG: NAD(P)H nitroreductase [Clostridiales bacterium]|nr:NAD(P)H nitroreductase [Clostridiales bacterium]